MNTIDAKTIEKLIIESVATGAQDFLINTTDHVPALIPAGFDVVNLDKYQKRPSRKRGNFCTQSLDDFRNYLQREVEHMRANNDDIAPAVFIGEEKLTARAILDYGLNDRPGHCDHVAKFALKLNEEFKLIRDANKQWKNQLEFVNFLDDLNAYIHHLSDSDGEEIELKKGFQALRKIKFSATAETEIEESDYAKRQTGLAAIAVKSGHETNLPARVVFALHPSPDLDLINIEARLRIRQNGNDVMICLDIILLEKTLQCMMQAFRDKVIQQLDGLDVDVYVGEYQVS